MSSSGSALPRCDVVPSSLRSSCLAVNELLHRNAQELLFIGSVAGRVALRHILLEIVVTDAKLLRSCCASMLHQLTRLAQLALGQLLQPQALLCESSISRCGPKCESCPRCPQEVAASQPLPSAPRATPPLERLRLWSSELPPSPA